MNISKTQNIILSGQPRRHLLTTGWSIFVSQKRLVFGDAVLFLRYIMFQKKNLDYPLNVLLFHHMFYRDLYPYVMVFVGVKMES